MKALFYLAFLRNDEARLSSQIWHTFGLKDGKIVRDDDVFDYEADQNVEMQPVKAGVEKISPLQAWELARMGVPTFGFTFNPAPEQYPPK